MTRGGVQAEHVQYWNVEISFDTQASKILDFMSVI